ncbi:MAG: hypothetical protein ACT4OE_00695 [Sphingosinicella sp.]
MSQTIRVPYRPRPAFLGLHARRERWAIVVAHRRAGKTVACANELIRAAATCPLPKPRFAYIAPQLNQAKDIAWNTLDEYTQCFGPARRVNASELWIELPDNAARIRIYGADNPDRLRGLYLDGAVLDEFGDMDPETWSKVIRPALSDREGWAIFIGTPKGRNAFQRLWEAAGEVGTGDLGLGTGSGSSPKRSAVFPSEPLHTRSSSPSPHWGEGVNGWFRLMLRASESGIIGADELADARRAMSEDEYAQEYECSFDAAVKGAYWAKEIQALEAEGRIGEVPHDPGLPVHTAWDLGVADSTVIWFIQQHRASGETRVIDVVKGEGVGLDWYAKRLQERDWLWGNHYLPHDAAVRELGTGRSRIEMLEDLGIRPWVGRQLPVEDGIQAVRMLLPKCWFDRGKCAAGIEALRMYRRAYDERRQEFGLRPLHDWTSHYADALRQFATEHQPPRERRPRDEEFPYRNYRPGDWMAC